MLAMERTWRILVVEDQLMDFELLSMELGRQAHCHRVDREETMRTALLRGGWDAVISDHGLPGFSGLRALQMVRESSLNLPFLFLSGNEDGQLAEECLAAGAQGFLIKGDRALVPTLRQVLEQSRSK